MKNQFKNHYANGISSPLSQVRNAFFSVSTIGTAVCIASIALSFAAPDATFTTHALHWIICIGLALIPASIIDFVIIQKIGRFAITELISWISGAFYTPILRKVNTAFFVLIAGFGIFLSFVSSWDGSAIAAGMAPTFSAASLPDVVNSERQAVKEAVKPYKEAVKGIENKIAEAVKLKTSGELTRLAGQGNVWAKNEIASISNAVSKQHYSELTKAKSALEAAESREYSRSDKVINSTEKQAVKATEVNEKRSSVIWKMLAFIGVLPLIFGVFLLIAECNTIVMLQLPKEHVQKQQAAANGGTAGPGQRSDSFENLYSNP